MAETVLSLLVEALSSGQVNVVDLTQPLVPNTLVIELPSEFAPSPGFSMETISHYDDRESWWYWNTIRMGEHTGTHFDAPIHWITGKDLTNNALDTLLAKSLVAPPT